MDLQLTDRVAFVAGSSRGIGRAIAAALLREGCRVCITGRDGVALDEANQELRTKFGDSVIAIAGDFTQTSVIDAHSARSIEYGVVRTSWSPISAAAVARPGWQQEEDEWERLFNLNFFGSVRLAQAVIPYMQPHGGNILFVGSIVAVEATSAPLPYSAAKAALAQLQQESCLGPLPPMGFA